MTETPSLTAQDALLALMVAMSAADGNMRTAELVKITNSINNLPVFGDYDAERITTISSTVYDLLESEEGLDALFGLIRDALPERLNETAYAFCCDVAAADGQITAPEARMLEEVRYAFDIDRLHAVAIEWGARARHMVL